MKYLTRSIRVLLLGAILSIICFFTIEGTSMVYIPNALIAFNISILLCSWLFVSSGKGDTTFARGASVFFFSVFIGFPILGFYMTPEFTSENPFLTLRIFRQQ